MKLLHIIDDAKFIQMCRDTFQLDGVENEYIPSDLFGVDIECDIVVVHYMRVNIAQKINNNKFSTPIVWFFWGADVFDLGQFYNSFLFPKTKFMRIRVAFKHSFFLGFNIMFKTIFPFTIDSLFYGKTILKAIKKTNLIVSLVPGDYKLLQTAYDIHVPMFHLNYVIASLDNSKASFAQGQNILVGNSASFTSNHIEAIDRLASVDLSNRKVIIPLSYGDMAYAAEIKQYAERKLGDSVECILNFLPLEKYNEKLGSCSILIMNHLRQQGLGNILQSIFNGAHVYLTKKSTVYQFLKQRGFIVSNIEDLKELTSLDVREMSVNRIKCLEYFGREAQHLKVKQLLDQVKLIKLN